MFAPEGYVPPHKRERKTVEDILNDQAQAFEKAADALVSRRKAKRAPAAPEPEIRDGDELWAEGCGGAQLVCLNKAELAEVVDLKLSESVLDADTCGVLARWTEEGCFDQVESIDLAAARVDPGGLEQWLAAIFARFDVIPLDSFVLDGCTRPHQQLVEAFADTARVRTLRSLSLADLWLDDVDCLTLSQGLVDNGGCLTDITLDGNRIGPEGAAHLVEVLRSSPALRRVDLNHNRLVDEGAAKLLNCLSVCALHISHLGLGANGIRSLSDVSMDAFRGNELRMLSLRDNHLGVDGSLDLAQRLRNAENLTALYVSNNSISDDGLRYLLASLTPHSDAALQPTISGVRCLDASSNGIGKKGCAEFAAFVALPGVRLLKLDLSFNPGIGDDGLTILDEPLADAPSLRHLTLLSCGVQDTKSYTVETRSGYTVRVELDDAEEVSDSDGEDA